MSAVPPRFLSRFFGFFVFLLLALSGSVVHAVTCTNVKAPSNPDSAYTIHGDGTVTDTRNGLMWKQCSEGQTWSGGDCTGTASQIDWNTAMALKITYAGYSDWRMPTIDELKGLIEACRGYPGPTINDSVFPRTPSSYFWSGSPFADDTNGAWFVGFSGGLAYYYGFRRSGIHVRLVRGGQSSASLISTPNALMLSGASAVQSNGQLTLSASAGYTNGTSKSVTPTWSSSNSSAATISSNGVVTAGSVNANTSVMITASYTEAGSTVSASKSITVEANAVVVPNTLSLSGASSVQSNGQLTLSASAGYSNGTSKSVTPIWSSSNLSVATVSSNGVVTAGTVTRDTSVTITASYTENGVTKTATHTLTVKAAAASVISVTGISIEGATQLAAGEAKQYKLVAKYSDNTRFPENANTWSVDNIDIAAIDRDGKLSVTSSFKQDATLKITATYKDDSGKVFTATYDVTVKLAPGAIPVTGLARYRPQVLMAGIDPMLLDYNDSSFKVFAVVRSGAADIDSVQLKTGDAIFSQALKFNGTLDNGDQVWTSTLKFPRGAFNQDAVLGDLFGSSNSQFQFKVLDKDQGEHSFPVLTFDNLPMNPAPVASPGIKFQLDANAPPIKRAFPQVLVAGFDPQLIDLDDNQFKVVAIVRKGTVDIQSVAITQNQGPFMQAMEKTDTLANGDLMYSFTFTFPRGSFPKMESADLFGVQLVSYQPSLYNF